jgi:hypothetical protein
MPPNLAGATESPLLRRLYNDFSPQIHSLIPSSVVTLLLIYRLYIKPIKQGIIIWYIRRRLIPHSSMGPYIAPSKGCSLIGRPIELYLPYIYGRFRPFGGFRMILIREHDHTKKRERNLKHLTWNSQDPSSRVQITQLTGKSAIWKRCNSLSKILSACDTSTELKRN